MSYIHEALNKAQKERDASHGEYSGVLARRKLKKGVLPRRSVFWIAFSLVVIFLAFASYSWLDSGVSQPTDKPVASEHKYKMPATTQRAEPTRSTGAKGFYERANVFHKKGRLREAKRLYREALRRDPGHVDALNNLAVIYMREKNYSAAERSLEKAIRLKPRNVDTHYNLACVYAIKGELSKSLSQLKRAGTLDPSVKQWALKDSDLKNARNAPGFEKIIKK